MEQRKREKGQLNTRYGKWFNLYAIWLGISIIASLSVLLAISSSVLLWIELKEGVLFFLSFFSFIILFPPLVLLIKVYRENFKRGYHYTIFGLPLTAVSLEIANLLKEENIKYRKTDREPSKNHAILKFFLSDIEETYLLGEREINIILRERPFVYHKKRVMGTIME
jgi:hypothetical protein